jgi:maltose alpha-D-glucosyltransferase/alpha-amylase
VLENILSGSGLQLLERLLPAWLCRQRWFGAKVRSLRSVHVQDSFFLGSEPPNTAIVLLEISYDDANPATPPDLYQLPLSISTGDEAEILQADFPGSIIASLSTPMGAAVVHDATVCEDLRQAILRRIEADALLPAANGTLRAQPSTVFTDVRGEGPLPGRLGSAEQSNTSILYGQRLILKLFRRLQPGQNPDSEIGRFLTEVAHFPRIAPFCGEMRLTPASTDSNPGPEPITLAMLQGLVENEGDGWQYTLDQLSRFYEVCAALPPPQETGVPPTFTADIAIPIQAREYAGHSLDAAALLGRRTAELHLALATPTDNPAFTAEPFTIADVEADAIGIESQIGLSLDALKHSMARLPDDSIVDTAARVLSMRLELLARPAALRTSNPSSSAGQRIRIHGDYHLGQVLHSRNDYIIIDFEGEPARPIAERRQKHSPLKDVAGMLRSFSYAAFAGLNIFLERRPSGSTGQLRNLQAWSTLWENAVTTEFLRSYRGTISKQPELLPEPVRAQALLNAYVLEKALYELLYELNNRPHWVRIPLAGILALPR